MAHLEALEITAQFELVGTGRFELRASLRDGPLASFYSRVSAALRRDDLGVLTVGQFKTLP